jgi:hypothetical protein
MARKSFRVTMRKRKTSGGSKEKITRKTNAKARPNTKSKPKTPNAEMQAKHRQQLKKVSDEAAAVIALKTICADSGVCIAFGYAQDKIKRYFNHFLDFRLVQSSKRIGEVSVNGFVFELAYKRKHYTSYAVLKNSANQSADNLVYEYVVGKYIDLEYSKYFPCLIETYGLFRYTNVQAYENAKQTSRLDLKSLVHIPERNGAVIDIDTFKLSCIDSRQHCILTQHLKGVISLGDVMSGKARLKNEMEIVYILFQVYYFLFHVRKEFTHYDLHEGNVLLFEPEKGKKIKYKYKLSDGKFMSFESAYVVKIIDYGRCYIKLSDKFYKTLGMYCNPNQINSQGYPWFNKPGMYHINALEPNVSHDLRLYFHVKTSMAFPALQTMKPCIYTCEFGTSEIQTNNKYPQYIGNITDCLNELTTTIQQNSKGSIKTQNSIHLAHIQVSGDAPMRIRYLKAE